MNYAIVTKNLTFISVCTFITIYSNHFAFAQEKESTNKNTSSAQNSSLNKKTKLKKNKSKKTQEQIVVQGVSSNVLLKKAGTNTLSPNIMHTPASITLVPRSVLDQRHVKTLSEALQDVSSVTSTVGARSGFSGRQFLVRGFKAQTDMYQDGLRDFGLYGHDVFDFDSVAVIKGPSSDILGNGINGGAINIITKKPILADQYDTELTTGNGQYYRGTLDYNKKIGKSTAVRIEAVGDRNNFVARDYSYSHRWGIAPAITFGLDKKLSYTLQFIHQENRRMPDFGVPIVTKPGSKIGRPITEYKGIRRSNYYGNWTDHGSTDDSVLTGQLTYKLTPNIVIHNNTRYGNYYTNYAVTYPTCGPACAAALFSNAPQTAMYSRTGRSPDVIEEWSFQNVLSTEANFHTSFIRHQLVGGIDVNYLNDHRSYGAYSAPIPDRSVVNPTPYNPYPIHILPVDPNNTTGTASSGGGNIRDVGIFLFDQMWFTKKWSIQWGVRYDNFDTNFVINRGRAVAAKTFHGGVNTFNPNASLIYAPTDNQMYYLLWSDSSSPAVKYIPSAITPVQDLEWQSKVQKNRLYEIGGKWSLFEKRVGLSTALFHLVDNVQLADTPYIGDLNVSGDEASNNGLEMDVSGKILPHWQVWGNFSAYRTRIINSVTPSAKGKRVPYAPAYQGSLWTSYDFAPQKPYNISLQGGVTWRGSAWLNNRETAKAPAYISIDGALFHQINKVWQVSMNVYNLTNRLNYDSIYSTLVVPSTGRTFLLSVKMATD